MGLELINWLVKRNAKNVVINSRKGVTSGYQAKRVRLVFNVSLT